MNKEFKQNFQADMYRYNGADKYIKKFHYYFRKAAATKNKILKIWYRYKFSKVKSKRGLEIFYNTNIGKGLYIGHAYNITINSGAIIGKNVNIHKGVTIGQENRGEKRCS